MTLSFDLAGQTAIITGSSRGIGRAIAELFAAHGANVVISSRKQDACDEVAAAINARGRGKAVAIAASISSKDALGEMVEGARAAFGGIDILVCNAASNPYYGPLSGISDEAFEKIFRNNVLSNHWLAQLVAPGMIARRDGAIIIISSLGATRGSAVIGAYNISKAADLQLVRNLAVELGPHNIRVNGILPGLIKTDFAKALWDDPDNLAAACRSIPLDRIGEADEVAGAAVLLASEAGRYITGQSITVDGGASITVGGV
jgi:NAD(P)-dependent dehydrogenase (short-subunit alcohol dehydrogenase family)